MVSILKIAFKEFGILPSTLQFFYDACIIYVGSAISYRMMRTMNCHFKAKKSWEKKPEIHVKRSETYHSELNNIFLT